MQKLLRPEDLEGKTIRKCVDASYGDGLVLVFDNNDWCVIEVKDGASLDATAGLNRDDYGTFGDVTTYLSPADLLETELIGQAQCDHLVAEDKKREAERKRQNAQKLLAEAEQLEQNLQ